MDLYTNFKFSDAEVKALLGKDEGASVRTTVEVKAHVKTAVRELLLERLTKCENELYQEIFSSVNGNTLSEKIPVTFLIRELVWCTSASAEDKVGKFAKALSTALNANTDFALIELIADALGHMARTSPVSDVEYLECNLDNNPNHTATISTGRICEREPEAVENQIDLSMMPIVSTNMFATRFNHAPVIHFANITMQLILFLLLLWTWSVVGVMSSHQVHSFPDLQSDPSLPDSEMNALYDLYYSTNGPDWHWRTGPTEGIPWNFTDLTKNNPCVDNWQGVNCTFSAPYMNYHVTDIILPGLGLLGTLPESLSALTMLNILFLFDNQLTSTIPASLGNLSQLQYLKLNINHLKGTLPESLSSLTHLYDLTLELNHLSGTIPESLCKLAQLKNLNLGYNQFNGTIPESLGNLAELQYLYLFSNQLTGTIPAALGNLTHLYTISIYSNQLVGSIPESLGNLAQLQYLYLYYNQLTSTIPASLGSLAQLQILYLYGNQLTGTIPESLGNLIHLYELMLYSNPLTGTIPASLGNLTQLQYLILYSNQLTGAIPEPLGNLTQLLYFDLNINQLTGAIPDSISYLTQLAYLDLSYNQLTGTIPVLQCRKLQQLHFNSNKLVGTIPSLASLSTLKVLLLQNNRLTGNLDNLFDPTTQLQIETLVLNNNQLTGTLPAALFQLRPQTFVGSSNCFEGPLPISAICNNFNMTSFVVDGISAATSCQNKLFISAYTLQHSLGGSIPLCLFQLPNIATLHLSGNGFTGSIPNDIEISNSLTDLSLSHNTLTGSIPKQIQLRNWKSVDLSFNQLSGTLFANFVSNGSVRLEENRLSGFIPASFRTMVNISVLGSNTFFCSYDQKDLPENNPNREQYHCGSNSFDILYYVWLGACMCTAAALGYFEWKYSVVRNVLTGDSTQQDTNLYNALSTVCRLSIRCAVYSIAVLLPLYTLCSLSYGTRTYEYAYQVSAVYMSGIVPFVLYWFFWLTLLTLCAIMLLYVPATANSVEQKKPVYHSVRQTMRILVPYLLVDCIVVVGVNAAYVYVAIYQSSSLLLVVQTLLSIFKIMWGRLALPYLLAVLTGQSRHGKLQVITQIMVNMLNNIVIPCLVVAAVSPDCFYNVLVAAPAVTSTVYYHDCSTMHNDICIQYDSLSVFTSFQPPFSYHFQCSSSLITYYAPAFVSMCIVSTFVTPFAQYVCQCLHRRATPGTHWHRLLSYCVPRLMKPFDVEASTTTRGYLDSNGLMTSLISTIGIVLTFGVTFPPLCLALVVSIIATVFGFRVHVSRFITSLSQQHKENVVELLRAECNQGDAMKLLKKSVWVLVTISCWFYTLFLFDILGDAVGFNGAYWVLIAMPLMPLVMYIVYTVICKHFVNKHSAEAVRELEMQTLEDGNVHNILVVGTGSEGAAGSTTAASVEP